MASSWCIASSSSTEIATPSVIPTSSNARGAAETWPQPSSTILRRPVAVAPGTGHQPSRQCRQSITTPKALLLTTAAATTTATTNRRRYCSVMVIAVEILPGVPAGGRIACQEEGGDGIPTDPTQTTLPPPRVRPKECEGANAKVRKSQPTLNTNARPSPMSRLPERPPALLLLLQTLQVLIITNSRGLNLQRSVCHLLREGGVL